MTHPNRERQLERPHRGAPPMKLAMRRGPVVSAVALVLALPACGESAEDKAQQTVCSARADIKQQVDELEAMSVTTATVDGVRANLRAIGDGLEKIAGAQKELTGDRKQDVQKAGEAFKAEVAGVREALVSSVSLSDGKQQIEAALKGLASSYQAALAPIECS